MIDVYVEGLSIDIGRQGENLARNIYFDLSELINTYGEGTATLVHMRPSDKAPYVCAVTRSGTFLVWSPTNTDTAYAGSGKCELRWVVGDVLAKSIVYRTSVTESITGDSTVPSEYESWYEALLEHISEYEIASDQIAANTSQITANTSDIAVLDGRVDELTTLPEGSTTGDAELADIRVGADGTVYNNAGDAVRGQVNGLNGRLAYLSTGKVKIESGTYADSDGAVKSNSASRLRNIYPVPVDNLYSITVPQGYAMWMFRLDADGTHISTYRYWLTGTQIISNIITDSTKYINFGIKNLDTPSSDISGEADTVSDGFILTTITEHNVVEIENTNSKIAGIKEYVYQYENVLDNYNVVVGQAYGNVGSAIVFSEGNAYRHIKILKTDGISKVVFSTVYNSANVSSYIQYVDDNDIIISRAYTKNNYEMATVYTYELDFPTGATGVYITAGYTSTAFNYVLEVYKLTPLNIEALREEVAAKQTRDYNEIVKSVCRIADGLDVPHQSIIGYKTAYDLGFRAMLCDLRFTSDDVPVLEHDAYLNGNYSDVYLNGELVTPNTVAVANTTYADLLQYDFGYYKGAEYANTPIMTFEQMLDLCKRLGCEVWIETKVNMTTSQYDIVFGLIRQYGMEQKCVWNPQSVAELNGLIAYEPNVYINLHSNVSYGEALQDERVTAIINATNAYNKHHNSITLALGATITAAQFSALSEAGVGIMGTTLNTEQQVLDYYAQGKPYTCLTSVLTNSIIAGKVIFDHYMNA